MAIKLVIFEDDHDLMDLFREMLSDSGYEVSLSANLTDEALLKADLFLGDYRNRIVPFPEVVSFSKKHGIPLIAISGGDMDYEPQIRKPFHLDELEALIFNTLKNAPKRSVSQDEPKPAEVPGFFKDAFSLLGRKKTG